MIKAVIMKWDIPQVQFTWEPGVFGSEKTVFLTDDLDLKVSSIFRDENATLKDFIAFAEMRCPPRTRVDIDEILKRYELPFYDPVGMCMKSYGRSMTDFLWIDFNDSGLHWDDIKIRPD